MGIVRKIAVVGCGAALVATLAGCSGGEQRESPDAGSDQPAQEQEAAKDFDGSAYSDTGVGIMYLRTAGGTSEDGNVPEIAVQKDTQLMQIELDAEGMDGSVCTVYIDGVENTTMNAGEHTQQAITLQGDALKAGTHTVELVKMEGEAPAIYKKAEYKVA